MKAKAHEPPVGTWLDNVAWRWTAGGKVVERRTAEVAGYYDDEHARHVQLRTANGETMFLVAAVLVAQLHMGVVTRRSP